MEPPELCHQRRLAVDWSGEGGGAEVELLPVAETRKVAGTEPHPHNQTSGLSTGKWENPRWRKLSHTTPARNLGAFPECLEAPWRHPLTTGAQGKPRCEVNICQQDVTGLTGRAQANSLEQLTLFILTSVLYLKTAWHWTKFGSWAQVLIVLYYVVHEDLRETAVQCTVEGKKIFMTAHIREQIQQLLEHKVSLSDFCLIFASCETLYIFIFLGLIHDSNEIVWEGKITLELVTFPCDEEFQVDVPCVKLSLKGWEWVYSMHCMCTVIYMSG